MFCSQYIEGDSVATGSLGTGGLGAAILLCEKPKQQCDSDTQKTASASASPPKRLGLFLGVQINPDNTKCISIGLLGSFPLGFSKSTGEIK